MKAQNLTHEDRMTMSSSALILLDARTELEALNKLVNSKAGDRYAAHTFALARHLLSEQVRDTAQFLLRTR